jgi:hypothetical protein
MKNQKPGSHNLASRVGRAFPVWLCFIVLHLSFCLEAWGQSYSIDWSTIDGGGGTTTNTVCVWWPVSETTWQLQATANLVNTGSTWSPCSYVTNGVNCVFIESLPTGNRFYRLRQ